jgi:hypothetical protein
MKTKSYVYLFMFGLILALIACQKDRLAETQAEKVNLKSTGCPPDWTILNLLNPQFLWCKVPGCNCAAWVEIKGYSDNYDNFVSTVELNTASSVADFFSPSNSSVWTALFPALENDTIMMRKLQSGDYTFDVVPIVGTYDIIYRAHNLDDSDYFGIPVTKTDH